MGHNTAEKCEGNLLVLSAVDNIFWQSTILGLTFSYSLSMLVVLVRLTCELNLVLNPSDLTGVIPKAKRAPAPPRPVRFPTGQPQGSVSWAAIPRADITAGNPRYLHDSSPTH